MKGLLAFGALCTGALLTGCLAGGNVRQEARDTIGTPRVEAVYAVDNAQVQDPLNFQVNEQYIFQLVAYTSDGSRVVLDGVTWESSDDMGRFGTLGGNTGVFSARGQQTTTDLGIRAEFNGQFYFAAYRLMPRQVRLVGRVVSGTDPSVGLDGVVIDFFSPVPGAGEEVRTLVGSVRTQFDGSFRASIPGTTVQFQIRDESVPTAYFRSFVFDELRFDTGREDCRAPIPGPLPQVGLRTLESSIQLTPKVGSELKPDPTGCQVP